MVQFILVFLLIQSAKKTIYERNLNSPLFPLSVRQVFPPLHFVKLIFGQLDQNLTSPGICRTIIFATVFCNRYIFVYHHVCFGQTFQFTLLIIINSNQILYYNINVIFFALKASNLILQIVLLYLYCFTTKARM